MRKALYTLILFIVIIIFSNIIILPGQLLGFSCKSTQLIKSIGKNIVSYVYSKGYNSKIKISGKIKHPSKNKINVIIGNHISSLDWGIVLAILDKYELNEWYYVIKRGQINVPSFGMLFGCDNDIKVNKNWLKDQSQFEKQLDKIKTGNVIIFPAGTRFTIKKYKKAVEFSKKNNIPVYNNLLVPRTKGLWKIISYLNKKDKLDGIYDFTFVLPKYLKKQLFLKDILESEDLGDTLAIIRRLELPEKKYLDDMVVFKEWLFNQWKNKDRVIENRNKYKYIEYKPRVKISNIIIIIFCIVLTVILIMKFGWKYLAINYLLSYLVIYLRNYF